jgi:hypothetical protein
MLSLGRRCATLTGREHHHGTNTMLVTVKRRSTSPLCGTATQGISDQLFMQFCPSQATAGSSVSVTRLIGTARQPLRAAPTNKTSAGTHRASGWAKKIAHTNAFDEQDVRHLITRKRTEQLSAEVTHR